MAALLAGAAGTVGRFLFGSTLRTLATTTVGSGVAYLGYKGYKNHEAQKQQEELLPSSPQQEPPMNPQSYSGTA